jgi:hypothetical protein
MHIAVAAVHLYKLVYRIPLPQSIESQMRATRLSVIRNKIAANAPISEDPSSAPALTSELVRTGIQICYSYLHRYNTSGILSRKYLHARDSTR